MPTRELMELREQLPYLDRSGVREQLAALDEPQLRELVGGRQTRQYAAYELRAADTKDDQAPRLRGRAVPYGVWTDTGWYMERIMPGTFTKSIREAASRLPLLLFHDSRSFPIGASEEWIENDDGLDGVWDLDPDDEDAMTALRKVRLRMLTGMSVGFVPIEEYRTVKGKRIDVNTDVELDEDGIPWVTRRQARLLETSLTPTPAYVGAQIPAREIVAMMKTLEVEEVEGTPRRDALAARMKELGL